MLTICQSLKSEYLSKILQLHFLCQTVTKQQYKVLQQTKIPEFSLLNCHATVKHSCHDPLLAYGLNLLFPCDSGTTLGAVDNCIAVKMTHLYIIGS